MIPRLFRPNFVMDPPQKPGDIFFFLIVENLKLLLQIESVGGEFPMTKEGRDLRGLQSFKLGDEGHRSIGDLRADFLPYESTDISSEILMVHFQKTAVFVFVKEIVRNLV